MRCCTGSPKDMDDLRNDPEYETRWPHDVLASQLDRLIASGRAGNIDSTWREEVQSILRQAFASSVPFDDFEEQWNASATDPVYGDEEPF